MHYNFNDYWWLVVPKFHDRQAAIDRFVERFGYQPEVTKEDHQFFWIGPANERNSEND